MTKTEWVEKEIKEKEKVMPLNAQNKKTLRSMLEKEHDQLEAELFREDSNNSPVEGYFNKE